MFIGSRPFMGLNVCNCFGCAPSSETTGVMQHPRGQQQETDALRAIAAVFAAIDRPQDMLRFFEEVLTPAERRDLALRWELMRRLHQGQPQRQIASALGISLCKITRGSRVLKAADAVSTRMLHAESDKDKGQPDTCR